MNKNELIDKVFDEVLYYAVSLAEEEMMKELENNLDEKVEFSKEHVANMQKIFKVYRQKLFCKKIVDITKRVAIFFIIISVVGAISIMSVEAWRLKILNFFIEVKDNHSDIYLKEGMSDNNSYKIADITFGYIPDGFTVENTNNTKNNLFVQFTNGNNLYFSLNINDVDANLSIDTENADFKKIFLNGVEALLSEKGTIKILVWHNDKYMFTLIGNIETSELIKIAENIKK